MNPKSEEFKQFKTEERLQKRDEGIAKSIKALEKDKFGCVYCG